MNRRWKLLLSALLILVLLYLYQHCSIDADRILTWQPDNLFLAAIVILAGFALKSATVFFPIMILQILTGHLYPRNIALLINTLGVALVMTVPYWIGKKLGTAKIRAILKKYPQIQTILDVQDDNRMAFSFMLRACSVPPADMVTMYLGASGMPFSANVIGSVLGYFPGMVMTTFLGTSIRDSGSPEFRIALILNIAWILLSSLGFYLFKKIHSGEACA